MVKRVGIHNQAKGLIAAVAKQMPPELRAAMARHEHTERSKRLDAGEVAAQAVAAVGSGVIEKILSARVKGSKTNPLESRVVVLYETKNGRTARCAIDYRAFTKSIAAFDSDLESGKIVIAKEGDLPKAPANASLEAEVQRLAEENARLREGGSPDAPPPSPDATDPRVLEAESKLEDAQRAADEVIESKDEEIARLQAELTDRGVSGDGEPAEAIVTDPLAGIDLDQVELPAGKSAELVAGMPFFDLPIIAALETRGEAKATREAATAELAKRRGE
jgi:hypothetical protein